MKWVRSLFENIDERVDQRIFPWWQRVRGYFPVFSVALISLLIAIVLMRFVHNESDFTASLITSDLERIVTSLHKIDESCDILSFDHDRNYVDFLTVKQFDSSEVSGLNLAHPENWQGPYMKDNPEVQGKVYEIIKAKDGVFVVPGTGVKLPNGLILGESLEITKNSFLGPLLVQGANLNYNGEPLARKLVFRIGDWKAHIFTPENIEGMGKALKEFNEAMPYTQRYSGDEERFSKFKIQLAKKVS